VCSRILCLASSLTSQPTPVTKAARPGPGLQLLPGASQPSSGPSRGCGHHRLHQLARITNCDKQHWCALLTRRWANLLLWRHYTLVLLRVALARCRFAPVCLFLACKTLRVCLYVPRPVLQGCLEAWFALRAEHRPDGVVSTARRSPQEPHNALLCTARRRQAPCFPQQRPARRLCEGSWMGARHSLPKQEHARRCQVDSWVRATDFHLVRLECRGAPATLRKEYNEAIRVWCELMAEQDAWRDREGAVLRQMCVSSGCGAPIVGFLSRCVPFCLPPFAEAFEKGEQYPPAKPAPVPCPPWLGEHAQEACYASCLPASRAA
jgi:hypothetical protein